METITLSLSNTDIEKLKNTFSENMVEKNPPYSIYQLRVENCVITAYTSGKVVFQGKDAQIYASPFSSNSSTTLKKTTSSTINPHQDQAGSDEVGTGDYFGPVCVCATVVKEEDMAYLKALGVQDSKAIQDAVIRKIAPNIMSKIPYSLLILENDKYNQIHDFNNLNAIKAKLHNKAYINLAKKVKLPTLMVIDQFTPEKSYYNYLKHEPQVVTGIHFETKAENKYIAVACGSIIARYAFLKKWDEMEEKFHFTFEKGAGDKVDTCIQKFVDSFGFDALNEVAKLHFKNTEKIK